MKHFFILMQSKVSESLTRSLMIEMSQQLKSKMCCGRSQFQEVHAEQKRSEWVQIGLSHSGRLGRRMPPWSEVMASSNYVRPWQKLMESFATRNRIRGRRQWRIDLTACEGSGHGTLALSYKTIKDGKDGESSKKTYIWGSGLTPPPIPQRGSASLTDLHICWSLPSKSNI